MSKLALGAMLLMGGAEMADAFMPAPGLLHATSASHATIASRAGRAAPTLRKSAITMMAEAKEALGAKATSVEAATR